MRMIHLISLIARLALMVTLVLGLLYWIAQIPALSMLLTLLVQIHYTSIHEGFGLTGALFLLVLSVMAVRNRGARWLALLGVLSAFLLPAFGLTQAQILVGNLHWLVQIVHLLFGIGAMYLALGIEKRYQQLKLGGQSTSLSDRAALQDERYKGGEDDAS
jgi:hypothetical protein